MSRLLFIILLFGYILLQLIWFASDPRSLKEILKSSLGLKGGGARVSIFIFVIIISSIILFNFNHTPMQLPSSSLDQLFVVLGMTIYITGFTIAVWARFTMKEKWVPAGEKHDLKRQNKIITSGPFKYSRNPIYLGLTLFYLGFCLVLRSFYIIFVIITFIYFLNIINREEAFLEKHFGREYLDYKRKTPKFI